MPVSDVQRVLVIGLDGMSPEAVTTLTARGVMPTLGALVERGVRGVLESTIPPFTCPAWPTMCTGVGPGRHGVFSFVHRSAPGDVRVTTSADLGAPRFWQLAAKAGRRAAILYVPTMYPADAVQPLFVSGFPTPDRANIGAVYPPEAEGALREAIPTFQESNVYMHFEPREGESRHEARLRIIRDGAGAEAHRVTAAFDFAAREPLDLAMAVFSFPDNVFHGHYGCVVDEDPEGERLAVRRGIDASFGRIDAAIAHLLDAFGEPATVLVVSDHGFTRKRGTFYVGECLRQAGLLKPAGIRYLLRRIATRQRSEDARVNYVAEDPWTDRSIDWCRTQAFPGHDHELGVFVNLAGRNPAGIVDPQDYDAVLQRARDAILAVRDPETGERPIRDARRRDVIYSGPRVDRAPDLLLEPATGWHVRRKLSSRRRGKVPLQREQSDVGIHAPDGILLAAGDGLRPDATLDRAGIADVGATVLALMGLAPAEPLDGCTLDQVFAFPQAARTTVAHDVQAASGDAGYAAEDEARVGRRLEDLGYL